MIRWLTCKLLGHRWRHLRFNPRKHANLFYLSSMAGYESVCDRCHLHYDDTWSPEGCWFGDELVEFGQSSSSLPVAIVRRNGAKP